jgi:hypothetical protein
MQKIRVGGNICIYSYIREKTSFHPINHLINKRSTIAVRFASALVDIASFEIELSIPQRAYRLQFRMLFVIIH